MADDSVYNTGSTITWLLPRRGVGQIKGGFSWLKGEQSSFQNVWGGQIGALICGQVFLSPRDYKVDHSSYLALGLLKLWFLSPLISYFSSNFLGCCGIRIYIFPCRFTSWICPFSPTATAAMSRSFISAKRQTVQHTFVMDGRHQFHLWRALTKISQSRFDIQRSSLYDTYANWRLSYSPTIDGSEPLKMAFKLYPPARPFFLYSSLRVHHTTRPHAPKAGM